MRYASMELQILRTAGRGELRSSRDGATERIAIEMLAAFPRAPLSRRAQRYSGWG